MKGLDGKDKKRRGSSRNGEQLTPRFSSLGTGFDAANSRLLFLEIGGHK